MQGYIDLMKEANKDLWLVWKKYADSRGMGGIHNEKGDKFWAACVDDLDAVHAKYKDTVIYPFVRKVSQAYVDEIEAVCKNERGDKIITHIFEMSLDKGTKKTYNQLIGGCNIKNKTIIIC